MKRILNFFVILIILSSMASATNHQGNWRWRNDDGSESSATWKAAENSITTVQSPSNIRLRVQIYDYSFEGVNWGGGLYNIAYRKAGDIDWAIITNDPSTNHFVLSASPNFADGSATTIQMTPQGEGYSYIPGFMIESTFPVTKPSMPYSSTTEWEYCIRPTANITRDSYYFQVQDEGGTGIASGVGQIGIDVSITTPSVSTNQMSNIQNDQAICLGSITDDGSLEVIGRGVCWNTSGMPTIADGHTPESGSFGLGNFTAQLTGLAPNTTYYVRSYATNTLGTGYGNEIVFTTVPILGQWGLIAFGGLIALVGAAVVAKRYL